MERSCKPIIFDGIDLSESLLGTGPGKRDSFIYFNDMSFGGIRVKNYKTLYNAKDTTTSSMAPRRPPGSSRHRRGGIQARTMAGSGSTSRGSWIRSGPI